MEGRERRWEGQAAFEFLASGLVLLAMRPALANEWEVRDPDPALKLVEAMVSAGVGDGIVRILLEQAVLPKLARGVTEWDPRTDTVAIRWWIHPWLPFLGSRLAGLFPDVRRIFEAALTKGPFDANPYAILSP